MLESAKAGRPSREEEKEPSRQGSRRIDPRADEEESSEVKRGAQGQCEAQVFRVAMSLIQEWSISRNEDVHLVQRTPRKVHHRFLGGKGGCGGPSAISEAEACGVAHFKRQVQDGNSRAADGPSIQLRDRGEQVAGLRVLRDGPFTRFPSFKRFRRGKRRGGRRGSKVGGVFFCRSSAPSHSGRRLELIRRFAKV